MNGITRREESNLERIERFQSLKSGEYWKSRESIPEEAILAGDTLLLVSIRWVENKAHTIILRAHPRHYDKYISVEYDENGKTVRTQKKMNEHRFLVNDFLNRFDFDPEHQRSRDSDIAAIHALANSYQNEMSETLSTPALMNAVVSKKLLEDEAQERQRKERSGETSPTALPPALYDESVSRVTGTVVNALQQGVNSNDIQAMAQAAQQQHRIAEIQARWLQAKNAQISETLGKLMPYFNEVPAAALAKTEEVRNYVEEVQSGIKSIYLYTGESVLVETIRKGESAPANIPLTAVQRKLVIEEEMSVWADVNERFDFRDIPKFFKALSDHPALVDQIFPTQRCVLVMATTNQNKDYGDPWTNQVMNKENRKVFLMVRDGENLYQVVSPVESHLGSNRLFPSQDEAEAHFKGMDGTQIKFDDVAYTDRLNSFELRALHYRRFLLLICGLDHREKLFGDFYDEPPSMNFVSIEFQEKYLRFLHDDDGSGLLASGEDRPSLRDFIKNANGYLRSGSRLLCNWNSMMTPETAPGACKPSRSRSSYRDWEQVATPQHDFSQAIAYRKGQSLLVSVEVKRYFTDTYFNCNVTLTERMRHYDAIDDQLPFLCLDAVDPDELEWYVHSRKHRASHLYYIRFFKTAIKMLREERELEIDARARMAEALNRGNIGAPEERLSIINQAVIAWRAAQRGAALHTALESEKSWRSLLDQMYMLAGRADEEVEEVRAFVSSQGHKPLRLVVNASGKLTVYAAPKESERDDRAENHAWVHRISIVRGKTKIRETNRTWSILADSLAAETTVYQWEDAKEWVGLKSVFSSFNAKQKAFERISRGASLLSQFSHEMDRYTFSRVMSEWAKAYDDLQSVSKYHVKPQLIIPVGYRAKTKEGAGEYLCVTLANPEALLYKLAPDEGCRNAVISGYISWFKDEHQLDYKQELIDGASKPMYFGLSTQGDANITNDRLFNVAGSPARLLGSHKPARFADSVTYFMAILDAERSSVYWSPELMSEAGEMDIDELVNNPMPDSYQPVDLVKVVLKDHHHTRNTIRDTSRHQCTYTASGEVVKFSEWYDISPRDITTGTLVAGVVSNDISVQRLPFNNKAEAIEYVERNNHYREYKDIGTSDSAPTESLPPPGVTRLIK